MRRSGPWNATWTARRSRRWPWARSRAPVQHLLDQVLERQAGAVRDLRQQAGRRHPGQGVDLEDHLVAAIADDQIDAASRLRSPAPRAPAWPAAAPSGSARATGARAGDSRCGRPCTCCGSRRSRAWGRSRRRRSACRRGCRPRSPCRRRIVRPARRRRSAGRPRPRPPAPARRARSAIPNDEPSPARLDDDREAEGAVQLQQVLAAVGLDHVAGGGREVVEPEDLLGLAPCSSPAPRRARPSRCTGCRAAPASPGCSRPRRSGRAAPGTRRRCAPGGGRGRRRGRRTAATRRSPGRPVRRRWLRPNAIETSRSAERPPMSTPILR